MTAGTVHLCVLEKFIPPFIRLIEKEFGLHGQQFILSGKLTQYFIQVENHTIYTPTLISRLLNLKHLYRSEKIILHGLYDAKFLYLLALQPWLLKKCYWCIWGDDLYQYLDTKRSFKGRFKERVRAFVIKHIGHLVTYIPGDYELAKQWYGSKADMIECLMYDSNVFSPPGPTKVREKGPINILLGNSAYPRNNHLEMLQKLASFADADIRVFVPLSYGPKGYAKTVVDEGTRLLGDKFVAIFELMKKDDYLAFLDDIDIAIFNNTRQQAMGNIISLIGKGKTVFLRTSTTTWDLLNKRGIIALDAEDFSLKELVSTKRDSNVERVRSYFSYDNLCQQLTRIV